MAASIISGDPMAGTKAAPQETTIANLLATLGSFKELAGQISGLKAETLQREVQILTEIITRITPLVPILSRGGESYYRRDIIIVTKREDVPMFINRPTRFFSEHKLVLYENGALFELHRFGETSGGDVTRLGWEMNEECEHSAVAAIAAFGLQEIAQGLIVILKSAHESLILKEELEDRLAVLVKALEALQ